MIREINPYFCHYLDRQQTDVRRWHCAARLRLSPILCQVVEPRGGDGTTHRISNINEENVFHVGLPVEFAPTRRDPVDTDIRRKQISERPETNRPNDATLEVFPQIPDAHHKLGNVAQFVLAKKPLQE